MNMDYLNGIFTMHLPQQTKRNSALPDHKINLRLLIEPGDLRDFRMFYTRPPDFGSKTPVEVLFLTEETTAKIVIGRDYAVHDFDEIGWITFV